MFCTVLFCFTIPLGTHKKGKALYNRESQSSYHNCRKTSQPSGNLIPGHVQCRHMPRKPHTNQDGIPFCILPYLNISDFLWFKVYMFCFHYPT